MNIRLYREGAGLLSGWNDSVPTLRPGIESHNGGLIILTCWEVYENYTQVLSVKVSK